MNESEHPRAEVVSRRWVDWRRRIDIDDYDQRFERLAAAGHDVHGEADFITSLAPSQILDAGCGTGRIAVELARRGFDVVGVDLDADMIDAARRKAPDQTWIVDDLARMQLSARFDLVAMPGNVMIFCEPADRRLIVHNMAQHLLPGGRLVAGFSLETDGYTLEQWDEHCAASGLVFETRYSTWSGEPFVPGGDYHVSVHRRNERFAVHDLVTGARADLKRLTPDELSAALLADSELLIANTRTPADRALFGHVAGSVHLPRTV